MLRGLVRLIGELSKKRTQTRPSRSSVQDNALIESFAIKTRNVILFLLGERVRELGRFKGPHKNDITAEGLVGNSAEWMSVFDCVLANDKQFLAKTLTQANKQVAHLTEGRSVMVERITWEVTKIWNTLHPLIKKFEELIGNELEYREVEYSSFANITRTTQGGITSVTLPPELPKGVEVVTFDPSDTSEKDREEEGDS